MINRHTCSRRIVELWCAVVLRDISGIKLFLITVAEQECAEHPLICAVGCRFQCEFLAEDVLTHTLINPIQVFRHEVLVDTHLVIDILIGRLAVETESLSGISCVESNCCYLAQIRTVAVVVDVASLVCLWIIAGIGISPLIAVAIADVGRQSPSLGGAPVDTATKIALVELVNLAVVVGIGEISVVVMIAAVYSKSQFIAKFGIVVGIH